MNVSGVECHSSARMSSQTTIFFASYFFCKFGDILRLRIYSVIIMLDTMSCLMWFKVCLTTLTTHMQIWSFSSYSNFIFRNSCRFWCKFMFKTFCLSFQFSNSVSVKAFVSCTVFPILCAIEYIYVCLFFRFCLFWTIFFSFISM